MNDIRKGQIWTEDKDTTGVEYRVRGVQGDRVALEKVEGWGLWGLSTQSLLMEFSLSSVTRHKFTRFKYAEEFAHEQDRHGRTWKMYRAPDIQFVDEDEEEYMIRQYVVEVEA